MISRDVISVLKLFCPQKKGIKQIGSFAREHCRDGPVVHICNTLQNRKYLSLCTDSRLITVKVVTTIVHHGYPGTAS